MPTSALNRCWNREGDKLTAPASVSGDHALWRFSCMRASAVRTRGSMRHHFLLGKDMRRECCAKEEEKPVLTLDLSAGHVAIAATLARVNDSAIAANAGTK